MANTTPYPNLSTCIERSAAKIEDSSMKSIAKDGVIPSRISDALAQLPYQAKAQADGLYAKGTVKTVLGLIGGYREALAAQLAGVDEAIKQATAAAGELATQTKDAPEAEPAKPAAPATPKAPEPIKPPAPAAKPTPPAAPAKPTPDASKPA